jgi:hypothetical protein
VAQGALEKQLPAHARPAAGLCMARIGDYQSAPDAAPASWVIEGLRGFAQSVLSLVPEGFEAYARIFHPAGNGDPEVPVRWRDIAQANGRTAHRMMQWPSITGSFRFCESNSQPGVWDHAPGEGSLPEPLVPVLTSVLARHTGTPGRCWFAVWDGWGALEPGVREAPVFDLPHRRLFLLTGPITAVRRSLETPPWWQSPTLWWPDDRAWCVETEVDLESTYVGGTRACLAELLCHPDLEAVTAQPADGVTWASDQMNPAPARD